MNVAVRRVSRFLARMDARTASSLVVSTVLLTLVLLMLLYGQSWLNLDGEGALTPLFAAVADSPAAVLGVIGIFAVLALTGFPQIVLITATVLWFGAAHGALYAWIATMVSATMTFLIGRVSGGAWVRGLGGDRSAALIGFLQRRGLIASGLIRVVPSAPFIVVNAAAGAARIPWWKYWVGTGIGIVPKIATVAALRAAAPDEAAVQGGWSGVIGHLTAGGGGAAATIAAVVLAWLGVLALARFAYVRVRAVEPPGE